jgi:hypothetical protein
MANSLRLGGMAKPKTSEIATKIIGISEMKKGNRTEISSWKYPANGKNNTCLLKVPNLQPEVLVANARFGQRLNHHSNGLGYILSD